MINLIKAKRTKLPILLLLCLLCGRAWGQNANYVPSQIGDISNLYNALTKARQRGASPLALGWPCFTRAQGYGNATGATATLSNGSDTCGTYLTTVVPTVDCSQIRFVYGNYYSVGGGNGGDMDIGNDITISVVFYDPTLGAFFSPTFGGASTVTVARNQFVVSDPIDRPTTAGTASFFVKTNVAVSTVGQKWPLTLTSLADAHEGYSVNATGATGTAVLTAMALTSITLGSGGTNYTVAPTVTLTGGGGSGATAHAVLTGSAVTSYVVDAGGSGYTSVPTVVISAPVVAQATLAGTTPTATSGIAVYGPCAILGTPRLYAPAVAVVGDSISMGVGYVLKNDWGFSEISLANFPHIKLGASGDTLQNNGGDWRKRRIKMLLASGCDYAIDELGTNDVVNNRTLAQMQADSLALWGDIAARGIPLYKLTVIPRTASIDVWATTANQKFTNPFTVTAASNTNPIVVTATSSAYSNGQRVALANIGGNTAANGTFYAGSVSGATFSLYSDAGLTVGVAGNGAYTSGGAVSASEAARRDYNDWIRDGAPVSISGASFTALATGTAAGAGVYRAGMAGHPLKGYFEAADTLESARNSGFWKIPTVSAVTGTATSGGATTCVDSGATWTTNQYQYCFVSINSGPLRQITSNTATSLTIATGTAVANGNSYQIYYGYTNNDGIHPIWYGHQLMGASIDTTKFK